MVAFGLKISQKHCKSYQCTRKKSSQQIWYGLWVGGIIGPYCIKDDAIRNVTVNGEHYREMILDFLFPKMEELHLHDMWFNNTALHAAQAKESVADPKNYIYFYSGSLAM